MGARGRHSTAELSVISNSGIESIRRPDPPRELTDEQAREWRLVVNRMPADWFPAETQPMLVQYCRHIVRARRLAQMLDGMERAGTNFDPRAYRDWTREEAEQSRAISSLATRMRLSQQSIHDREKKKGPSFKVEELWAGADHS